MICFIHLGGGSFPANNVTKSWLDDVLCFGYENGISNCAHPPFSDSYCSSYYPDAGVICSGERVAQPCQLLCNVLKNGGSGS